jgi:D-alanine-D-alanine ligase
MAKLAVLFGGPSPEHDISILAGLLVGRLLHDDGHDVSGLYWTKSGEWLLVDSQLEAGDFASGPPASAAPVVLSAVPGGGFFDARRRPKRLEFEVAVNCCHGGPGENGALQAALDLAEIPYTGPSAAGAALAMDKYAANSVARAAGVPVNDTRVLSDASDLADLAAPLIVKPRWGGSSIGIEVVADLPTARDLARTSVHLRPGAVVEPFLAGWSDLQVAVRRFPATEASVIERPTREGGGIYSYSEKYLAGREVGLEHAPRELPATLPEECAALVRRHALRLAEVLGVRGAARIDFLWDGEQRLLFNEMNTIPGSLALYLWAASGIDNQAALRDLVEEARRCPATMWSTEGADGSALRSAGAIAAKLA